MAAAATCAAIWREYGARAPLHHCVSAVGLDPAPPIGTQAPARAEGVKGLVPLAAATNVLKHHQLAFAVHGLHALPRGPRKVGEAAQAQREHRSRTRQGHR